MSLKFLSPGAVPKGKTKVWVQVSTPKKCQALKYGLIAHGKELIVLTNDFIAVCNKTVSSYSGRFLSL